MGPGGNKRLVILLVLAFLWTDATWVGAIVEQRKAPQADAARPAPRDVTLCQLATDSKPFDRARIRITTFVRFGFEDFSLFDPTCDKNTRFSFWVTFGGDVASGAIYCCPGEGMPGRSTPSAKAAFPLVDDKNYRAFRQLLQSEGDTTVRVTAVGTLLRKPDPEPGNLMSAMRGYGHMGCCSLFVIEQIERFDEHTRKDLLYRASGGFYEPRHCWSRGWHYDGDRTPASAAQEQRAADAGDRRWAFDDPHRVALEALRREHGADVSELTLVKAEDALQVYEWRHDRKWSTAVVIRPYWLSLVARTEKVVWTADMLETDGCDVNIRPDGDIRAQVRKEFTDAFSDPIVDPRLPADVFAAGKVRGDAGPPLAEFYEAINSYAVALATDDRGWPSWVDIRPKTSYPVPIEVWPPLFVAVDINVPMDRTLYDEFFAFLDAVRPLGSPIGALKKDGNSRTQQYEHGTVTWEDGSAGKKGRVGGVRSFSVKWK